MIREENKLACQLAWRSILALLIAAVLVAICYFFIDRPVAFFVYDQHLSSHVVLKWLTYPPPILQAWSPVGLIVLVLLWMRGPWNRGAKVLLALCISIIVADQCRESLAYVLGRYWPETWINNNPSLIKDNAYGFHFFQGGASYGSFPSGHMTRIVALAAVLWLAFPRGRVVYVLVSLSVAVGLLGMNYHFVGDVVAGTFIGAIVGVYTTCLLKVDSRTNNQSR